MADRPEPTLKKLDLTIARLRLLLAEVRARLEIVRGQRRTYGDQRDKLLSYALYGDATLDTVQSMLMDLESRIANLEATERTLTAIESRAERELESLQLTKGVEEARSVLSRLQAQQVERAQGGEPSGEQEVQAEIGRLQALINEASERAAQTIGQRSPQP